MKKFAIALFTILWFSQANAGFYDCFSQFSTNFKDSYTSLLQSGIQKASGLSPIAWSLCIGGVISVLGYAYFHKNNNPHALEKIVNRLDACFDSKEVESVIVQLNAKKSEYIALQKRLADETDEQEVEKKYLVKADSVIELPEYGYIETPVTKFAKYYIQINGSLDPKGLKTVTVSFREHKNYESYKASLEAKKKEEKVKAQTIPFKAMIIAQEQEDGSYNTKTITSVADEAKIVSLNKMRHFIFNARKKTVKFSQDKPTEHIYDVEEEIGSAGDLD